MERDEKGRFPPGVSGNPKGKPKGTKHVITNTLIEELAKTEQDKTNLQVIIEKLISKAKSGDLKAIEMVVDRLEGKAKEFVELSQPEVKFIRSMDDSSDSEDGTEDEQSDNSGSGGHPTSETT